MVSRNDGGNLAWAISARPPATWMAPSWSRAPSSSVRNSGFPAVPAIWPRSSWPGSAATASHASSRTASAPSGGKVSCRAPAVCSARISASSSVPRGTGRIAPDNRHRQTGQAPGHGGNRQQAGRVRPLQIIGADHHRPGQGERLHQVTERIDHPELQARIAGHRDRMITAAVASGQQFRDGGPLGVPGPRLATEGIRQQAERPRPLQLFGTPRSCLHAPCGGAGERLLKQARLPDPGLAFDKHDRQAAAGCLIQCLGQRPDFCSRPRSRGGGAGLPISRILRRPGRQTTVSMLAVLTAPGQDGRQPLRSPHTALAAAQATR